MSDEECTLDITHCKNGEQQQWVKGTASAVIFVGAVVGQLTMGFLGDYFQSLSRNAALTITLSISAIAALLSAVVPFGTPSTVYTTIITFRFIIGIGLGGIFPLSATKASEDSASTSSRTNSAGATFAFIWQLPGLLAPWLLSLCLTYNNSLTAGMRWRLVLGLGAIPPALAILCLAAESILHYQQRVSKLKPTEAATAASVTEVTEAVASPVQSLTINAVMQNLRNPELRSKLLACGGPWFMYDVVFYGLSLLGGVVLGDMSIGDDDVSANASIRKICTRQSIALALSIAPIILTYFLLKSWSLKFLQITGFLVQAFFLALFVVLFTYLRANDSNGLFALYCLALMSLQLGVPVTTYALPASVFRKDIRCTFNGMASAMGKIGAIIGAYTFYYIAQASIHAVLVICVIVCLIGALMTHFYIEDGTLSNDDSAAGACNSKSSLFRTVSIDMEDSIMFSPLADHSLHSHCDHENYSNIDTSL